MESDCRYDMDVHHEIHPTDQPSVSNANVGTDVKKIKIDSQLIFSKKIVEVENEIKTKVRRYDTHEDKLSCIESQNQVFPTDSALVQLASMAYSDHDKQQGLPNGWQFLTAAWNSDLNNGYYGCAYFNEEHQQIVIAHRGTNSLGAVWNDLKGIVYTGFVAQMNSAATFTHKILCLVSKFNFEGAYLKLSFTGHSLGGWLAQVTTFTAKYLTIDEDRNKQFSLISDIGYHAHTVAFDNPGCEQMLRQLRNKYITYRYGDVNSNEMSIDSLDITAYLSAPNRINCCNAHVGKLYRIFVNLPHSHSNENNDRWRVTNGVFSAAMFVVNWSRKHLWHTMDSHGLNKIIACFDPQTGLVKRDGHGKLEVQEVLNWPITEGIVLTGSEYDEVMKWASQFENYRPPVNQSCSDKHDIRYHTKDVDENSFKLNVFNEKEICFAHGYDICRFFPKYKSVIFSVDTDDSKVVLNSAIEMLDSMKFQFDREKRLPLLDPKVEPLNFIGYVKNLSHFFSNLIRVELGTKNFAFHLIMEIYKDESIRYLKPIIKNSLKFDVGSFNLCQFLNNDSSQVLLQVEKQTSVGALKIYKVFELLKSETKYNSGNSICLDVETLLRVEQLSFASVLEDIKEDYLIVIESGSGENDQQAFDLLKGIFEKVRGNHRIKVILIVEKANEADWADLIGEHERSHHEGIHLGDLSSDSRKEFLETPLINFQGHRVSLARIIPELEKLKSTRDLFELPSVSNRQMDVGHDYLRNSRFDVFAVSNMSVEEFESIVPPGERVITYEEVNPSEMVRFVVLDKDQAETQFNSICWRLLHKFRVHWLNLEGDELILKDSRSHFDGDNDEFIEKLVSTKLQTRVHEVLVGCYVIGEDMEFISSRGKHLLRSIVNPDVLMKLGSQEEIKAGSELPQLGEVEYYYINRNLTTTAKFINPRHLIKNCKNDIYFVSNIKESEFLSKTMISTELVIDYDKWIVNRDSTIVRFITTNENEAGNRFLKICQFYPNKNIHWLIRTYGAKNLDFLDNSYDPLGNSSKLLFKYENSRQCSCDIDVLNFVTGTLKYEEYHRFRLPEISIDEIRDSIATVKGSPGMGKSTFFTHLALDKKERNPSVWVVNLQLKAIPWDNLEQLYMLTNPLKEKEVVRVFIQILNLESAFERSLFEYCLYDEKVVLFLDAFDEASPKYDDQIFGFLETLQKMKLKQLWLSSRPYALKHEPLMGTVCTLLGLDSEEQRAFLMKFWSKQLNIEIKYPVCAKFRRFMEAIKDLMPTNNDFSHSESMAGIPLILKILAETYQNDVKNSYENEGNHYYTIELQRFAVHIFYEKTIEKSTGLMHSEKLGIDTKKKDAEVVLKKQQKTTIAEHKLLALVCCDLDSFVPEQRSAIEELIESIDQGEEITGLISGVVNGVPQFIHTTFAEYFAALWLIDQMVATNNEERFIQLFSCFLDLLKRESAVVLSLFNSQLGDNQLLTEKLTRCLPKNKELVETISDVSENYLNIIRFLIALGIDMSTLYGNGKDLIASGVTMEDTEVVEYFCNLIYGNACDYTSIILDNRLLYVAAATNIGGSTTSFLLSKIKKEKLKYVVNEWSGDCTPLHYAVFYDRLEVAKVLIENGAEFGLRYRYGDTALLVDRAIFHQNEKMIELVLCNLVFNSPLDFINHCLDVRADNVAAVFMNFIEKCFEQSSESSSSAVDEHSDLGAAVGSPNHTFIKSQLSSGTEEMSLAKYDLTLLLHSEKPVVDVSDVINAASHYEIKERIVIALIGCVALKYPSCLSHLFRSKNKKGKTLLHMAARLGWVATAELMIGLGADVDTRNDIGETAISVAANCRQYKFFIWLLSRKDEIVYQVADLANLTNEITIDTMIEIINKLSSDESSLLYRRYDGGDTVLHIAARFNLVPSAKMIIDRGANLSARNDNKHTPLSLACKNNHFEMVEILINEGAAVDDEQQSPLLWAIYNCSRSSSGIIKFLIEQGADVNDPRPFPLANDKCWFSPLQLFVYKSSCRPYYDKLAKILIIKGCDLTTCFDYFPFHIANVRVYLIRLFVMCGADVYATNNEGVSVVSFLEEHWQSIGSYYQMELPSVFLFSKCKLPQQLIETFRNCSKRIDFALSYESQLKEKFPDFFNLIDACKEKDIRNIQQCLNAVLASETELNTSFNNIRASLLSQSPLDEHFFKSVLEDCLEFIGIRISVVIKRDVSSVYYDGIRTLYDRLKLMSNDCDNYFNKLES